MDAATLIVRLGLEPHPEGGHYRATWRDDPGDGTRGVGTAIYFLLAARERSHWHRVDGTELWHFHAGAPLRLEVAAADTGPVEELRVGIDLASDEQPQRQVPAGVVRHLGRWVGGAQIDGQADLLALWLGHLEEEDVG